MPFLLLFLLIPSFVSAADPYRFEVKTIAEDFARPMGMDLGPDGSIYLIELQGKVNRIHPTTGKRTILAEIEVFGLRQIFRFLVTVSEHPSPDSTINRTFSYNLFPKTYLNVSGFPMDEVVVLVQSTLVKFLP